MYQPTRTLAIRLSPPAVPQLRASRLMTVPVTLMPKETHVTTRATRKSERGLSRWLPPGAHFLRRFFDQLIGAGTATTEQILVALHRRDR